MSTNDSTTIHPNAEDIRGLIVRALGDIDYDNWRAAKYKVDTVRVLVRALLGRRELPEDFDTSDVLDACGIPYTVDPSEDQKSDECIIIPPEWLAAHGLDDEWREIGPGPVEHEQPDPRGATLAVAFTYDVLKWPDMNKGPKT